MIRRFGEDAKIEAATLMRRWLYRVTIRLNSRKNDDAEMLKQMA
jgi:hypothetical protein